MAGSQGCVNVKEMGDANARKVKKRDKYKYRCKTSNFFKENDSKSAIFSVKWGHYCTKP